MKKTLLTSLALVIIVALATGLWILGRHDREMGRKYEATRAAEDSLRTRFDAALVSIAEIQDSLTAILPSESAVLHVSQDVERGGPLTATRKDQVLRTISDLNESIRRSKELIHRLEQRLKDSDVRIASLERLVANLKKSVTERERMIATLTERVDALKVQVAALQTDVENGREQIRAQQQVIEDKRREISTIRYLVTTRRRLKDLGVIRETGGLIGLGRTPRLTGQFPERVFHELDTDAQTTIEVPGLKPVVLSGQSSASYQLVPVRVGLSELRITDPPEFRKVRYLVIQVE